MDAALQSEEGLFGEFSVAHELAKFLHRLHLELKPNRQVFPFEVPFEFLQKRKRFGRKIVASVAESRGLSSGPSIRGAPVSPDAFASAFPFGRATPS